MSESALNQKAKTNMPTRSNWSLSLPVPPPVPQGKQVNSVAVNQDGTRLVAGTYFFNPTSKPKTQNVGVFAYDEQQNQKLADIFQATAPPKIKGVRGVKTGVQSVAISRDGVFAAAGGLLGTTPLTGFIKTYHVNSGTPLTPLPSPPQQTAAVALDEQANYLIAGADQLYIFKRSGTGAASTWSAPTSVFFSDRIVSVAVSQTGQWIVAGIAGGWVALVENSNGAPVQSIVYQIPNKAWVMGVAMSFDGTTFAVAASDANLYYFKVANFPTSGAPEWFQPLVNCTACRSVALSDNGTLVAVSAAEKKSTGGPTGNGEVHLLRDAGNAATAVWTTPGITTRSPNLVSVDSKAQFVAVAAGSPPKGPTDGYFYGFDASSVGPLSWSPQHTGQMDYPIQLSADGSAAVGGSDNGDIYYFVP